MILLYWSYACCVRWCKRNAYFVLVSFSLCRETVFGKGQWMFFIYFFLNFFFQIIIGFTGTLRGLSFLLICKTMTIHWTCGASAVCLQEWWALCLKWLFHTLYFNYFAFSSRKHQTTVFLLPTDFSQGTILLWSWQSRPACQNCKGNPKFVLFEMC